MLAFTIHIYCDFSGYSDIARGLAKLMGFDFLLNFRLPYLATNFNDFWLRWQSLSTWLRDYHIPLGGNRGGTLLTYRNMFLVVALSGLWHGAAWPYVLWGSYHGVLLVLNVCGWTRGASPRAGPSRSPVNGRGSSCSGSPC